MERFTREVLITVLIIEASFLFLCIANVITVHNKHLATPRTEKSTFSTKKSFSFVFHPLTVHFNLLELEFLKIDFRLKKAMNEVSAD